LPLCVDRFDVGNVQPGTGLRQPIGRVDVVSRCLQVAVLHQLLELELHACGILGREAAAAIVKAESQEGAPFAWSVFLDDGCLRLRTIISIGRSPRRLFGPPVPEIFTGTSRSSRLKAWPNMEANSAPTSPSIRQSR
jgi:hypothetical protein